MGLIFKHMKDTDVVKNVTEGVFSKIKETKDEQFIDGQIGNAINIEDTYELIPYKGTTTVRTIVGTTEQECVKWAVIRWNYDAGTRYHSDGSGEPTSWEEEELACNMGFRDAILVILNDWMSLIVVDNALENMSYEDEQMEEDLNPMEM